MCEIIFGSEDEPDARFVYLEDCGHCIESSAMDQWMQSRFESKQDEADVGANNNSNSIQLPECPRCKTPIRRNLRYSKYVKTQLALIEKIKLKQYGDNEANKEGHRRLGKEIQDFINKETVIIIILIKMFQKKKFLFYFFNTKIDS